ncbi:MBL fold metallo-hydrolase [Peribacillus sp. SCS-37]|uniref:MBL fold metallo-hydrolase n=1 Tax=Paraperibacillus esterisolvens TaxID=3115296 RepID=UPI003906321B
MDTPFSEGFVNAFAVLGETATLVDTGNPGRRSFNQLNSQLKEHGLTFKDFDSIVLTHMHTDHSGGVMYIQEEADLPVYVHELAEPVVTGGVNEFNRINDFFKNFLEQCGANPSEHQHKRRYKDEIWKNVHYLKDGDNVHIGGTSYEVTYVPGHSQTDLLFWNSEEGIALVGDHIIPELSVNAFIEPPPPWQMDRPKTLLQYRESLNKVKSLPLKTCFSGHGKPFDQHGELIDKRLTEHEKRCRQIHEILSWGSKNIYEICLVMYPQLRDKTMFLGLSQIQGHLDLMEVRGEVKKEEIKSAIIYKLV